MASVVKRLEKDLGWSLNVFSMGDFEMALAS